MRRETSATVNRQTPPTGPSIPRHWKSCGRLAGAADMRRVVGLLAIGLAIGATQASAHKPVTSPFTYTADVLPIVRARCGSCHAPGGVAPMSLLTHADAVPWSESM